jgi:hypothetical protein
MINYSNDVLINVSDDGMNQNLWQLAYDDAAIMSKLQIRNDKERNLIFYLDNFIDDLFEEFGGSDIERNEILYNSFNKLRAKDKIDLLDIRKAVYDVINKPISKKVAYPNSMGVAETNALPVRDVDKWIASLKEIYSKMYEGEDRETASKQVTEGWNSMEKSDFNNWAKFYEGKNHEKYNVKTAAVEVPSFKMAPPPMKEVSLQPQITNEDILKGRIGRPPRRVKTKNENKQALISRLDSASKILRDFANVWPREIWERLSQALADLQREVVLMKAEATIVDCIIRTANIWDREGFSEGAKELRKIAQPPEGDVAKEIEDALTGKKEEKKEPEMPQVDMPPMGDAPGGADASPPGGADMPPPGGDMPEPPPEMPPAGVGEELPAPPPPPDAKSDMGEPKIEGKKDADENPYVGKTVQDVLEVLGYTAQQLSERKIVRELTKADMMLDALNIASHFPELGEAIAKMMESTNYVHIRLEKIIGKLKGGLKEETDNKESEAPVVEMEELAGKSPTPPSKEQEMFEVSEEPTAPAEPVESGPTE